ncbi:GNAT family N-acetyltransferase [Planococcus sp. CP5-4]|uniref:GNAT family N-acetyltransferase n=1 Tax=unclassified Planococcus (in: firmicutes) TaxID=2662419 RepID=UPI001C23BC14|nr:MULTISPECIES: N-acetyltransferase [unclassified Planococcus (in: firmicutes)]MBU9674780.1 GNAT family N-acetyltransferase [Planococcus sp. CP5-4_YE]MBV0910587.1 GNAT family N-acetyltransferase [Planococcus sp. CP5-4_UN]MBW6065394.1 GNAT family N-acetyltransferase [Planococcus sp. CP5-4]
MDYRRLTQDDAEQYRKLRLTALQTDADAFSTDFNEASQRPVSATAKNLANPSAVTFGAYKEGRLLVMMTLLRLSGKKTSHRAEVLAVYAAEETRGTGLAPKLLDHLLAYARECDGLEQLELAVNSANPRAIRFYERSGFQRIGITPNAQKAEGRYIDELLMVLKLQK